MIATIETVRARLRYDLDLLRDLARSYREEAAPDILDAIRWWAGNAILLRAALDPVAWAGAKEVVLARDARLWNGGEM